MCEATAMHMHSVRLPGNTTWSFNFNVVWPFSPQSFRYATSPNVAETGGVHVGRQKPGKTFSLRFKWFIKGQEDGGEETHANK